MSVSSVAAALTPAAAVIVVHVGGVIGPGLEAIADLCERRGVVVIEEAAHAAVGLVHLDHLDEAISVRRAVASRYDEALRPLSGVTVLEELPGSWRNVYKYPVLLDPGIDQAALCEDLGEHGIALSGKIEHGIASSGKM